MQISFLLPFLSNGFCKCFQQVFKCIFEGAHMRTTVRVFFILEKRKPGENSEVEVRLRSRAQLSR